MRNTLRLLPLFFPAFLFAGVFALGVEAQTESELQAQISASNAQIEQLKNEIAQLQVQLNETGKQKQTLQSAVQELTLNIQKITKSVTLTEAQIKQKDLEIGTLSGSISTTSEGIGRSQEQIGEMLRELADLDSKPAVMVFLSGGTLSSFFDEATTLGAVRDGLERRVQDLSSLKVNLETNKNAAEGKRKELASLNRNLNSQKQSLAIARDSQNKLLADTKNKESEYQSLLAQKKAQQAKFESDLANLESQLNKTVNPNSFAGVGAGVLSWPVDAPYITQYFGNTEFSTANPQIYNGRGHNAIDLRATDGTPIKAALSGIIEATGNTDAQKGCYSYGKWVLIRHNNGLSTLYAHLSSVQVSQGQAVGGGEVIGLSGRTGYATGPHLHFGVYATQGVEVVQFTKSVNCKNVAIPIADPTAYLNPLSYLPALR